MKVKICGIRRPEDVHLLNSIRLQSGTPDYIGFIFAPGRRRTIDRDTAISLAARANPSFCRVGVFVDSPPEKIEDLVLDGIIHMVQLHGTEDPEYILTLREHLSAIGSPARIMKAFRIETRDDLQQALSSPADLILLDHGAGGSGNAFDWSLLRQTPELSQRPWFLAGGLTPDNVADAIDRLQPYGIDVSSGVETHGIKDAEKIRAFLHAIPRQSRKEEHQDE